MEQKTEASQAVDDLDALARRLDRIHTACCDTRPKQAVGEMIYTMLNMPEWNQVRAALNAQPAPTDAPKVGRAALSQFMDKYCLGKPELVSCAEAAFYWFNKVASGEEAPSEAAQGEDSARLADGYKSSTMVSDFYGPKVTLHYETTAQAEAVHDMLVDMIDRASAETGGVKS